MSDMEKVIEKALQCVPMVDASQTRIREIQAQKIAQALTASGYGGFEVVRGVDVRELVEAVRQYLEKFDAVEALTDADPTMGEVMDATAAVIAARSRLEAALPPAPEVK